MEWMVKSKFMNESWVCVYDAIMNWDDWQCNIQHCVFHFDLREREREREREGRVLYVLREQPLE